MQYQWSPEKNDWLRKERGVSFEKVIFHLERDDIWQIIDHPNQDRYPGQRIYLVAIEDYVYFVPFIQEEKYIFLKTIIPNRKATKDYLDERGI